MMDSKENTLKSILSALWNLSAHCTENKSEICSVDGALGFLVDMLTYKTPSKSLAVIENSGGILRNISSQIAVRDDYREVLRQHNCLQVLLEQLKSPSLTIVSNACGTLWNLSAKNAVDQETLWQLGAPAMLRSLNHSRHKMIAMGSSAALKNLLSSRPSHSLLPPMDSTAKAMDLPVLPTLGARKQRALLQDLDQNLSETFENIEKDSPTRAARDDQRIFERDKYVPRNLLNHSDLCQTFTSLNLEPTPNHKEPKISQSFPCTSLPYPKPNPKLSKTCPYIPVRNKYSDCDYEEIDLADQPIDYSMKYAELKTNAEPKPFEETEVPKQEVSFGIYTETDLDQPTDYSLRYAENDSDSDDITCNKITRDTIKTYCTEGTPYETPLNFSNATSMSDLRIKPDKPVIDNDKLVTAVKSNTKPQDLDEKDRCSVEDISETETRPKPKVLKSEFSSGLMSPEKPVNYCEEGTPGYFSRVSSFGSLNSIPANDTAKEGVAREKSVVKETTAVSPPKPQAIDGTVGIFLYEII